MILLLAIAGYLIGSIPTADWLGTAAGVNLRTSGTGNPGTANAWQLAGPRLAIPVLALDASKGAAAVILARALAGDPGGLVAGIAAVAGQILNPWFGFRGGKGLATSLGVVLTLWPPAVALLLPVLAVLAWLTGSAARGVVITGAAFVTLAGAWVVADAGTWWGVLPTWSLFAFTAALTMLLFPKFLHDLNRERLAV